MNAGAGVVEADEAASLAICRELTGNIRRQVIWAVHELRDMGYLPRDLVETAERFSAMHLKLEPRSKAAFLGDGVSGGAASPHRALLKRSALAERIDHLYGVVAKKIGASDLVVFAMSFDVSRPSIGEIKAASGRDFVSLSRIIETGLTKLWACEPLMPRTQLLNGSLEAVDDLARI